ncbi:hypothetical protein H072_1135 [Dactylellina haptotyla CBS 200.50]|uniref:DUF2415 domain-containing protein n=1 Tax=Dactylellina haptotyla (strain CBS 200.50) TaxID=1284197 RepID=S8APV7_DACHA|nr:hypothetical protein H072_1135 [Dactylellina haptotyla CBS 200.50]
MPLLPEIPGFYYDNEKKKYFKITAAHTSTSSVYNADRVKQEREAAREAEEQRREDKAVRPYLKRRRRISDSSNGLFNYRLRMQMGLLVPEAPRRDGDLAMWATVLCEEELIRANRDKKLSGMETMPGLGGFFTFAPNQGLRWYPQPYDHFYEERNQPSRAVKLPEMENRMTSSTIMPEGKGVLVASGQSYAKISLGKYGQTHVDSVIKVPEAGTIWACAINESGIIAIGGSYKSGGRGLLSLTSEDCPSLLIRPESDVLALQYIDKNVLLTGSRSGKIHIYDSRRNLEKEVTHEKALASHVSSITHLRKLENDNYIIVNGLGGQTALHDLRYCRPIQGHQRGHTPKGTTKPVLTYKNFNKSTIGLGFDIDHSQELMAIAGEDNNIRLYSISSGQVVKTLEMKDEISSIRFSKDSVDGCRDMLAASGQHVYRFHTGYPQDEDVEMEY